MERLVTRSDETHLENDPDALTPLLDQPFDESEIKSLNGHVAAYEAGLEPEPTADA